MEQVFFGIRNVTSLWIVAMLLRVIASLDQENIGMFL